jgi:hypothetical protein
MNSKSYMHIIYCRYNLHNKKRCLSLTTDVVLFFLRGHKRAKLVTLQRVENLQVFSPKLLANSLIYLQIWLCADTLVWQNLAPFSGRPISGAVEALLTKVINTQSSVSPIVVFFVAVAVSMLA